MRKKTLVVYCSILSHTTPPFSWYNTAQKLGKTCPVVFIELSVTAHWAGILGTVRYFRWVLLSVFRRNNFLLWNFTFPLSQYVLFLYLLILKFARGYQIVLFTNVPESFPIYHFIPADRSCFDCVDVYSATEFAENKTQIQKFNVVFVSTQLLFSLMKQTVSKKVRRISSGYYEHTERASENQLPKITQSVVFSGGISHRIDYQLLQALAQLLPNYQFFFMGEMYLKRYYVDEEKDKACFQRWEQLLQLPNVHYLGSFSAAASVRLLPLFEIGIIPYDMVDVMNYYSHPVKLYEYLAAGLSVVSTPLPSVVEYVKDVPIFTANTATMIAKLIKDIGSLAGTRNHHTAIQQLLKAQSVEQKIEQIAAWLKEDK